MDDIRFGYTVRDTRNGMILGVSDRPLTAAEVRVDFTAAMTDYYGAADATLVRQADREARELDAALAEMTAAPAVGASVMRGPAGCSFVVTCLALNAQDADSAAVEHVRSLLGHIRYQHDQAILQASRCAALREHVETVTCA